MKGAISNTFIYLALIALLGILAYSNTFDVPFHFDDRMYIEKNPLIKESRYFFRPSDSDILGLNRNVESTRKTRDVGYMSFYLNYKLNDLRTTGYHAVNLLIHIMTSFLVYLLVMITFKTPFLRGSSLKEHSKHIALFAGLLFVAHPVQTQAVTYISQRFASLAACFYLASIVCYISARLSAKSASRLWFYVLSFFSAVIAMKTKENAFTLPLVIALYEFMFFEGARKRRFLYLLPLLLTMLIIPLSVMDFDKPVSEMMADATKTPCEISRHDYFVTQFRVIVTYLRLLVFPIAQNLDYDYPIFNSLFNQQVLLSFVFLLVLFLFSLYLFQRSIKTESGLRLIAFGGLWFFITLSVESSIVTLADVINEHRAYLPSVGIFSVFATGAFLYLRRFKSKEIRLAVITSGILMLFVFSYATYERNIIWKTELSLWEDVVRKSPGKARGHYNLSEHYREGGLIDKAEEHYLIALRLNPDFAQAHNNLGNIYASKGLMDKALEHYRTALKLTPDYAEAHVNLGNIYASRGLTDEALEHYRTALRLNPDYAKAHYNLGAVYYNNGLIDRAMEHYRTALRLNPDYAEAHYNLGDAYASRGLTDKASEHYRTALRLNPDYAEAYHNLGIIYYNNGLIDRAMEHYRTALRLNPDYAEAYHNLGLVYSKKGMDDKAMQQYQEALRINPNFIEAHNKLGILYRKMGLTDKANKEFEAVRKLNPDFFQTR
jgi:tetratricopeptide (TPR) repeat protein